MIKKITDLWPNLIRRITQNEERGDDHGESGSGDDDSEREALLPEGNVPDEQPEDDAAYEARIMLDFKNLYWTRLVPIPEIAL